MNFPVLDRAGPQSSGAAGVTLLKLVVVLSVILPVALFAIVSATAYDSYERSARSGVLSRVELAYEHARRVFAAFDLAASLSEDFLIDRDESSIARDNAELSARLARLVGGMPEVEDISVVDADGMPVVTASQTPAPLNMDFSTRRIFAAQTRPGQGVYVSERQVGRLRPQQIFDVSYRRRSPDGDFTGIIGISANPLYFEKFYATMVGEDVTAMSLVRNDGAVLARVPTLRADPAPVADSPFLRERARHPDEGSYIDVSALDGVERLVAYRSLEHAPVYVVAALDMTEVRRQWRDGMTRHLYFGIPATFSIFLISLAALRQAQRQSGILKDLRREGERRAFAEEALRQANKLEAIGRLTGGVAHDFNNLLQVMLGRLSRIQKAAGQDVAPASRDLDAMQFAIDRAAMLTHRLLAFSRQQPLRVDVVDVDRLIDGMTELVRQTAGAEATVEISQSAGLWPVSVDASQLENAILNITSNARDAMAGPGRIVIRTQNVYLDDHYVREHADATVGPHVCISVADTGEGIPADVIAKIFEPFFTTKPIGQGTGLGLSMVYGFVRQSGGHVTIESQVGKGATVRLYLPRYFGAAEAPSEPESRAATENGGAGEILVVEDEREVRALIVDTLTDMGYTPIAAADAQEGLRLLEANPGVRLLLTDVGLPDGMNGRQLADIALARRSDLKIVFMTGYAGDALLREGRLETGVELLTKPFTRSALAQKIRETLTRVSAFG